MIGGSENMKNSVWLKMLKPEFFISSTLNFIELYLTFGTPCILEKPFVDNFNSSKKTFFK